jgi:hypothetical protein
MFVFVDHDAVGIGGASAGVGTHIADLESRRVLGYNQAMRTLDTPKTEKTPTVLSPAELAAIDEAEPYELGIGLTLEEAHDLARKQTKAWMKIIPHRNSV